MVELTDRLLPLSGSHLPSLSARWIPTSHRTLLPLSRPPTFLFSRSLPLPLLRRQRHRHQPSLPRRLLPRPSPPAPLPGSRPLPSRTLRLDPPLSLPLLSDRSRVPALVEGGVDQGEGVAEGVTAPPTRPSTPSTDRFEPANPSPGTV